jgi:hypothetical protein
VPGRDVEQENRVSIESSHSTAERAYRIWEQMGRPEGQALEHWLMAEAEVASKPTTSPAKVEPAPAPRRGRRKKI